MIGHSRPFPNNGNSNCTCKTKVHAGKEQVCFLTFVQLTALTASLRRRQCIWLRHLTGEDVGRQRCGRRSEGDPLMGGKSNMSVNPRASATRRRFPSVGRDHSLWCSWSWDVAETGSGCRSHSGWDHPQSRHLRPWSSSGDGVCTNYKSRTRRHKGAQWTLSTSFIGAKKIKNTFTVWKHFISYDITWVV